MEVEQQKAIITLENPIKSSKKEHFYAFPQRVPIGALCKIVCPECSFSLVEKTSKIGNYKWVCPHCNTIVGFVVVNPEQVEEQKEQPNQDASIEEPVGSKEESPKPHTKKIDKNGIL